MMSERILNWGLLSTARINQALIPPIRASKRNRIAAVASRSAARAEGYALEAGIPRFYGSYEALLADPEIDVIYVSLPNSLHGPWTLAAADAGKHVLCEKPLGLTCEEIDLMAAAARRKNVWITEAFMYRHHPQTLRVKEIVDAGEIGEIRLVRGSFSFRLDNPEDVRLAADLGGGSIWDIGCYPISYMRMIYGEEPAEVFGEMWPAGAVVDLSFAGQLRFSGDRFGQFDCSFAGPARSGVEIVGTAGSIWVPNPYKPAQSVQIELQKAGKSEPIPMPGGDLYLGEVEDIADAILLGQTPKISLEDSRGNIAAIEGLLESARERRPVAIAS